MRGTRTSLHRPKRGNGRRGRRKYARRGGRARASGSRRRSSSRGRRGTPTRRNSSLSKMTATSGRTVAELIDELTQVTSQLENLVNATSSTITNQLSNFLPSGQMMDTSDNRKSVPQAQLAA